MSAPFAFYESADALGEGMIANVRAGIASVDELYDVLTEALHPTGLLRAQLERARRGIG